MLGVPPVCGQGENLPIRGAVGQVTKKHKQKGEAKPLGGFKEFPENTTLQDCIAAGVPASTCIFGGATGWPKNFGIGILFPSYGRYAVFCFFVGTSGDTDTYHLYFNFGGNGNNWKEIGTYPK